jgi:tetratricopeptide (TPR) repeat protein
MRKNSLNNKLFILIIFFISFLIYSNSLKNPFIWDQEISIAANPVIRSFKNIPNAFMTDLWGKKLSSGSFYRPLEVLSYMIDYSVWKLNPAGYHITSILIHSANAVLLFYLLIALKIKRKTAFISALIFTVHPVNTETVDYSIRGNLLGTLFCLAAFLLYLKYLSQKNIKTFIFSVIIYIFALLSKEWTVVLPLIMLVHYVIQGKRNLKFSSLLKNPLLIALASVSLAYFSLRILLLSGSGHQALSLIANATLMQRILTLPRILFTYVTLFILPYNLHMEYMFVTKNLSDMHFWTSSVSLAGFFYLVMKNTARSPDFNENRQLLFFFLWFLVSLAPFYNIAVKLHATLMEGWAYFAGTGFIPFMALVFFKLYDKASPDPAKNKAPAYNWKKLALTVLMVALSSYYIFITVNRNWQWGDAMRLYTNDLKYEPDSFLLNNNIGVILFRKGDMKGAKNYFSRAIRVSPNQRYAVARSNIGVIFQKEGHIKIAEDMYSESIEIDNYELGYENLARLYLITGRTRRSIEVAKRGCGLYPLNKNIRYFLGIGYFLTKNYTLAEKAFNYIKEHIDPDYKDVDEYLDKIYKAKQKQQFSNKE